MAKKNGYSKDFIVILYRECLISSVKTSLVVKLWISLIIVANIFSKVNT